MENYFNVSNLQINAYIHKVLKMNQKPRNIVKKFVVLATKAKEVLFLSAPYRRNSGKF
jgi:hypothetical protein